MKKKRQLTKRHIEKLRLSGRIGGRAKGACKARDSKQMSRAVLTRWLMKEVTLDTEKARKLYKPELYPKEQLIGTATKATGEAGALVLNEYDNFILVRGSEQMSLSRNKIIPKLFELGYFDALKK